MSKEFDLAGEQMSGGEQQKLAISHVYYKESRFVILDEPSSALDPIAEYEMYNRMLDACKDCGMIFISHRLASAVLADRIYLMEHGRVAECGSHEELMQLNGKYAEMFRRQAENYLEVEEHA
jgi:ATP-binding cassette subfamily B protein